MCFFSDMMMEGDRLVGKRTFWKGKRVAGGNTKSSKRRKRRSIFATAVPKNGERGAGSSRKRAGVSDGGSDDEAKINCGHIAHRQLAKSSTVGANWRRDRRKEETTEGLKVKGERTSRSLAETEEEEKKKRKG